MTILDCGAGGAFDARRFATSWLLPVPLLFALRTLISLFIFITVFTVLGLSSEKGQQRYFTYFTSLTFIGLGFYYAFAAIHTGTYWLVGRPLLSRWPATLQHAHWMLYSTVTTFPIIVTILFWAVLSKEINGPLAHFRNTAQHVLNAVFCVLEIVLPRTAPTPWLHLPVLVLILLLYLCVAYLAHYDQGYYVYAFLDPAKHGHGVIAGYLFAIFGSTLVAFVLVHYLIRARKWVTEKKWGMEGRFSRKDTRRAPAVRTETPDLEKAAASAEAKK